MSSRSKGMDTMARAAALGRSRGYLVYPVPHCRPHPKAPPLGDAWGVVDQFWLKDGWITLVQVKSAKKEQWKKRSMAIYKLWVEEHGYPLKILIATGTKVWLEWDIYPKPADMLDNFLKGFARIIVGRPSAVMKEQHDEG